MHPSLTDFEGRGLLYAGYNSGHNCWNTILNVGFMGLLGPKRLQNQPAKTTLKGGGGEENAKRFNNYDCECSLVKMRKFSCWAMLFIKSRYTTNYCKKLMVVSISGIMTSKPTKNTSTMLVYVWKRGHSGGWKSYVVMSWGCCIFTAWKNHNALSTLCLTTPP